MVLLAKEVQCSFVPSIVRSANTILSRTGGRSQNLNVQIYPLQRRIKWFCLSSRSNATSFVPSFAAAVPTANTTLNRTGGRSPNFEGPVETPSEAPQWPTVLELLSLEQPSSTQRHPETNLQFWAILAVKLINKSEKNVNFGLKLQAIFFELK